MPRDVEQRVREKYDADTAERIIKDFSRWFAPDWSEASFEEIDSMVSQVAERVA